MIYFDNAATGGKKPSCVVNIALAAIKSANANPGRSGHALSVTLATNLLKARKVLSDFFGGYGYERVVFTKNCTEALNAAIFGFAQNAACGNARTGKTADESACAAARNPAETPRADAEKTGTKSVPHVLTTVMEHNSVLRPLRFLERTGRIRLTVLGLGEDGTVPPSAFARAAREDTVAAVFTLASNVTGASIDPAEVKKALPDGVLVICDGAQACGHMPVDMKAQGIDALCVAGHKGMHGIAGSGALLFSARFSPAPLLYGGTGSESANPDMPPFYPDRLEAGTLNYPAAMSMREGALYLKEHMQKSADYVKGLTRILTDGLKKIAGIELFSKPNPFGIVSFRAQSLQSEFFAQELSDYYDIAVRGGLHCAPLMHRALGSADGGLVRASLSEFNTPHEAYAFLLAAEKIAKG